VAGRPTKLTPELRERFCGLVRDGNYTQAACAGVGISFATYRNWYNRGRKARKGPYLEFFEAVRLALAESEANVVRDWQAQIPENWQAARDFLARRFPRRWGPKESHEVTGKDGGPVQLRLVVEIVDGGTQGDPDGDRRSPDSDAPGAGSLPPEPGAL
jgi:hypothetical protein